MKNLKVNTAILFLICLWQAIAGQYASFWQERGAGGGGAVYAPSISPHDSNEVYLSCDMGLLMHSTNFGVNWRTLNFDTVAGFRNSYVNFTNHPDTSYVMKFDGATSKYVPAKTVNRGLTWDSLQALTYFGNFGAMRLFANPGNSSQLMVAGWDKIYFSNNGGSSFSVIHSASIQSNTKLNLAGVLYTNDTIFASTDMGILLSPNNGANWQYYPYATHGISKDQFVMSFAGASRNGAHRFFCTTFDTSKLDPRAKSDIMPQFRNVYRLDWSPNFQWQRITDSLYKPDTGQYNTGNHAFYVVMNPDNPDTFYLTGQTKVNISNLGTIFRSMNGGVNFSRMFLRNQNLNNDSTVTGWYGSNNFLPAPHNWNSINSVEGLAADPNDIMRLMESDYSGTHVSRDGGNYWQQCYTDTLFDHPAGTKIQLGDKYRTNGQQTTVCYWMNWLDSNRLQACYADLLMNASYDGGGTWDFNHTGLWSQKVNDIHMIARTPGGRLFAPEGEVMGNNGDWSENRVHKAGAGRLVYSTNGINWITLKDFGVPVSWICFDPRDTSKMYVACYSALDSTQGGIWLYNPNSNPAWRKLNSPPRTEKRGFQIEVLKDGTLLAVYGPRDPGLNNPSYTYTPSSGLFMSIDSGNTWADVTLPDSSMKYDARYLMIDPGDSLQKTWLLSVGNNGVPAGKPGLYRTIDRGQNWKNIMPSVRVNSVTFHPSRKTEMYVCTERNGLWYATNANTDAPVLTKINNYPYRSPQRLFFNPYNQSELWVTSIGNGLRVGYEPNNPIYSVTWTGIISNDWNNSGNWLPAVVPDNRQIDVVIPNGTPYSPTIYNSDRSARNLLIQNGATIFLNGNNLKLYGDYSGAGNIKGQGKLIFNGAVPQKISDTLTVDSVQIDNSVAVNLQSSSFVQVDDLLELKNGVLNTDSGSLNLRSNSDTHCAIIDNFSNTNTGTIQGKVTVQRFYNGSSTFGQHLMSSPVDHPAFSQFTTLSGANGIAVTPTANCDETQLAGNSNYGNVFEWNETLVSNCVFEGWVVRSSGNSVNAQGYSINLGNGTGIIDLNGSPNLNTIYSQTGLTNSNWNYRTLQGHYYNSGWHLIGNPYSALLDLNATVNPEFDNYAMTLHTSGIYAGSYQPLSMAGTEVLAPFQGFMAHKTSSGGTATFNILGSDRRTGNHIFFKTDTHQMAIQVKGNDLSDITYIDFIADATQAYDADLDAYKIPPVLGNPLIYTYAAQEMLSINSLPDILSTPAIPVGFSCGKNGTFTLTVSGIENLSPGTTVILEDKQLHVFQTLNSQSSYSFTANTADSEDRFVLHFYSGLTSVDNEDKTPIKIYSDGEQLTVEFTSVKNLPSEISIFNIMGELLSEATANSTLYTINMENLPAQVLLVQVKNREQLMSKKIFVK